MSSSVRENGRASEEATCGAIARRMVNLPRAIISEFSRAMNYGRDVMRIGNRRHQHLPIDFPVQHPPYDDHLIAQDQDHWAFLTVFERQYGSEHPFFYACRFTEALTIAKADRKFLFIYLHAPDHPFTPAFCRETLCSELAVQFLDANFVSWGGLANSGEGLHIASMLRPQSFPFCALIAPAPGDDSIAVLQQIDGPISPSELVEVLQRTVEEQGLAFGAARAKQEEKIRADRRLREEQDAAYFAALQIDKEKERAKVSGTGGDKVHKPFEISRRTSQESIQKNPSSKQYDKPKEVAAPRQLQNKRNASQGTDQQATQILIRFPNGDRREHSFLCTDKLQAVFRYIDSLGLPGITNYRLVSSFPRKTYGVDQMRMTLKDAGLHPRASLFLEPL